MYNVMGHGAMIADGVRMSAYRNALRLAITPGVTVLDVGTGSGVFAMFACQFGARKVYAIEAGESIQLARQIAAANGFERCIEFIEGRSTDTQLPERADVIVSDLRGVLPLFGHHLPAIIDARNRLLAPGGIMIPQSDQLWAAVVDSSELSNVYAGPWKSALHGLDMRAGAAFATNSWGKARVAPSQLLTDPMLWATLHYASVSEADVSGSLRWCCERPGTAHGITVWFDALLIAGETYSNSPMSSELLYGQAFFPLSQPVVVEAGDKIAVTLNARLIGEDYLWRWRTTIQAEGESSRLKAAFDQSTFFGAILSKDRLNKRTATYCPKRSRDGEVDYFILGLMDGATPLKVIAERVRDHFPELFASDKRALAYVADVSQRSSST